MNIPLDKNTDITQLRYNDKCDKYDYLTAVGCGAIAGIIDVLAVGSPEDSVLGKWTDAQVDNCVIRFAKMVDTEGKVKDGNIASAIGFLEKKYKVNYDHNNSTKVDGLFKMAPKNHHMKSLAHSPDVIGLFFSILNQFTETATFVNNGQLIYIKSETCELVGGNWIAKIFCGAANWFGHLMSDIAGSSGGRGSANGGRGSGIVIPFYELFGLCDFGSFNIGKDRQNLATLATRVFQEGYDARFGMTMAIPVLVCDLLIRLIWALRRFFQYKKPIQECIPTSRHDDLRVMLIIGNGVLCVIDGVDAFARSGGGENLIQFFTRLNLIAWFRFITLVIKEICIRTGLALPLQKELAAFIRMREEITVYLAELETIDIELFRIETEGWGETLRMLETADSEKELNKALHSIFVSLNIPLPWTGEFDEFMGNRNNTLVFK